MPEYETLKARGAKTGWKAVHGPVTSVTYLHTLAKFRLIIQTCVEEFALAFDQRSKHLEVDFTSSR